MLRRSPTIPRSGDAISGEKSCASVRLRWHCPGPSSTSSYRSHRQSTLCPSGPSSASFPPSLPIRAALITARAPSDPSPVERCSTVHAQHPRPDAFLTLSPPTFFTHHPRPASHPPHTYNLHSDLQSYLARCNSRTFAGEPTSPQIALCPSD